MNSSGCDSAPTPNETVSESIHRILSNARDNMYHLRSSRQRAESHLEGDSPVEAMAGTAQKEINMQDGISAMLSEIASLQRDTSRELDLLNGNVVNRLGS